MKVHILHDYDYDYEIKTSDEYSSDKKLYEVPDELIKEYEAVNKRREEIKDQLKLIIRRGPL